MVHGPAAPTMALGGAGMTRRIGRWSRCAGAGAAARPGAGARAHGAPRGAHFGRKTVTGLHAASVAGEAREMLCRLLRGMNIDLRPAMGCATTAFVGGALVGGGAAVFASGAGVSASCSPQQAERTTVVSTDLCFASAAEQQACMNKGQISAKELTLAYIERIKSIDHAGPRLCSVLEVNPEAVAIAEQLDMERQSTGPRSPLHGICVLLKDNVDTGDSMHTTAGSLALLDSVPAKGDATIATKLRDAGAIILGKANLSEWANYRGNSSSGWSGRGGQCKNPHVLDNTPGGSSSGSGSSIAAALATMAIGSETDGSIVSPSNVNGICGVKPTVGLVSRAGIVPISADQDTAGPMCRSVTDCASMLTVIAGADPVGDPSPPNSPIESSLPIDYVAEMLKPCGGGEGPSAGLKGARIGVLRSKFSGPLKRQPVGNNGWSVRQEMQPTLSKEQSQALLEEKCLEPLRKAGAILIDVRICSSAEPPTSLLRLC